MKTIIVTMLLNGFAFVGMGQTMEKEYFIHQQNLQRKLEVKTILVPIPKRVVKERDVVIVTFDRKEWEKLQTLYRRGLRVKTSKR